MTSMDRSSAHPSSGSRSVWRALLALALVGAAVRVPLAFQRGWIGYDEANYLMIARNARAGLGFVQSPLAEFAPKFHPLSYLAPQALSMLLGDELRASNTLFVVLGGLDVLLAGWLALRLFDARVGLATAALVAVAPIFTSTLVESISHTLFLPFLLAGLLCALAAARSGGVVPAIAGGLAIGLSWWARADGILVVPSVAAILAVHALLRHRLGRTALLVAGFVGGFAAMYAAYLAFLGWASGGGTLAHDPLQDFLIHIQPGQCPPTAVLRGYGSVLSIALHAPSCILNRIAFNARSAPGLLLDWLGVPAVLLPFVGAAWLWSPRWDRATWALQATLPLSLTPLLLYLPFYLVETRYVAPYAILAFVWIAAGAVVLGERMAGGRRWIAAAPTVLLALGLLATSLGQSRRQETTYGPWNVAAGRWLDAHARPDAIVWTSQSEVGYFARRAWFYPPAPGDAAAWSRLSAASEVWLVVDDASFRDKNPPWAALVPPASSEGLELAYETPPGMPTARIYRATPARLAARESHRTE